MKKIFYYLPSIIFNTVEVSIIFIVGFLLNIPFKDLLVIFMVFVLMRINFGDAMHYKDWKLCMLWSTILFFELFLVTKVGYYIAILVSVFCAYILTKRGNINDGFMWKGKSSKYDALKQYIVNNPNCEILKQYELYWKDNYELRYDIFNLYFREQKSYDYIIKIKDLPDTTPIKIECNVIYASLEIPLKLPKV